MLPYRLYEALPSIYALMGFFFSFAADNVIGFASCGVLIYCAVKIFRMRWAYRAAVKG